MAETNGRPSAQSRRRRTMPEASGLPPFNIPIPDPSVITEREIAKARNDIRREFELELKGMIETLAATRAGYVNLFEARLEGVRDRLDEKIDAMIVRFEGIHHQ